MNRISVKFRRISDEYILRYCRLFTLPIKVNKTSALTLLLNYVRSPDHENCRMCGVNCEFKTVHTIARSEVAREIGSS